MRKFWLIPIFLLTLGAGIQNHHTSVLSQYNAGGGGGGSNPAITFIGAGSDDGNTTSLDINTHASGQSGDLLIAFVMVSTQTISTKPTEFTLLTSYTDNTDKYYVYYAIEDASGSQSYSWTPSASGKIAGTIATYRGGFDSADPFDDYSNTAYRTSDANVVAGEITASEADENLILLVGLSINNITTTFTGPSTQGNGWTEDSEVGDQNSSDFRRAIYSCQWSSSGASGSATAVADQTSGLKHGFLIALNPE